MKKWGTGKIIIVTILALAILVLAGYFFGEKPSPGESSSATSSDTAAATAKLTPNYTK